MARLTGLKYAAFIGAIIGFMGAITYPVIIYPMMNTEYYKNIQREGRKSIKQEEVQPGNMKVWSDPFGRK
ncbi:UNVERIFIED_CONTAM: hypothetical protein RMT77_008993 [Armadillidium vulgare]